MTVKLIRATIVYKVDYPKKVLSSIASDESKFANMAEELPKWVEPKLTPFRHEDCPYVRGFIAGIDVNGVRAKLRKEAKQYDLKFKEPNFPVDISAGATCVTYSCGVIND